MSDQSSWPQGEETFNSFIWISPNLLFVFLGLIALILVVWIYVRRKK